MSLIFRCKMIIYLLNPFFLLNLYRILEAQSPVGHSQSLFLIYSYQIIVIIALFLGPTFQTVRVLDVKVIIITIFEVGLRLRSQ
jgi:hypothetical protein